MVSYDPNCQDNIKINSNEANAMADMVKMDRLGLRQMLRQAILTSMDIPVPILWGFSEKTT